MDFIYWILAMVVVAAAIPSSPLREDEEVMTLPQAAAWLKVSERTLWDKLDEIPHFRVGKQIRFLRSSLLKKYGENER